MNVFNPAVLQYALGYAGIGWRAFPLHEIIDGHCGCPQGAACTTKAGKHPRIKWAEGATTDEAKVRRMWTRWPNAGIAIATGTGSGLIVVDVDGPEGEAWLTEEQAANGALPDTAETSTGRGRHLYFNYPKDGAPIKSLNTGKLDLKADGGFVVAAPSPHASGRRYKWRGTAIADISGERAAALRAFIEARSKGEKAEARVESAPLSKLPDYLRKLAMSPATKQLMIDARVVEAPHEYSPELIAELREVLAYHPADCSYEDWRNVAMALHHGSGGAEWGFNLLCEWSRTARKQYDDAQWLPIWQGLGNYDGPERTLASLYDVALEKGWERREIIQYAPVEVASVEVQISNTAPVELEKIETPASIDAPRKPSLEPALANAAYAPSSVSSASATNGHDHASDTTKLLQHINGNLAPSTVVPVDIFGKPTREPELTRDMFPKVVADFAFDQAELIGVDPAMVAVPALAVCASACDDAVKIQPKMHNAEYTQSARLWVMEVAPPGTKKTAALQAALAPLKKVEADWRKAHNMAYAEYETAHSKWQAAKKKKPPEYGPEPKKPHPRRLIAEDVTLEQLANLEVHNTRGMLWFRDELKAQLTGLDRYHNKGGADRASYLEGWNGSSRTIDRVKEGGSVFVSNWSFNVLGGIQLDELQELSTGMQRDGALQRFFIFQGRSTLRDGEEVDRPSDRAAINAYETVVQKLTAINSRPANEIEASVPSGMPPREPIKLSAEAQTYRREVMTVSAMLLELRTTPPALKTHLAKWEGLFVRLLLTMHLIECMSKGNTIDPVVPGETGKKARDLMLKFFLQHALKIYVECFPLSVEDTDAQKLASYILARELKEITAREIKRAYHFNDYRAAAAMEALSTYGWVTSKGLDRRHQPVKWTINPEVHVRFAKRAAEEQARREAERIKTGERMVRLSPLIECNGEGYVQ